MLSDREISDVISLAVSLREKKVKEIDLLEDIIHNAEYSNSGKLQNSASAYAGSAERTFLEGKKLALLVGDRVYASEYDYKAMGTTEEFPCSLSYDDGIWEFILPPAPSVKTGKRVTDTSRYIGYLVRNLMDRYQVEYGDISCLSSPVVIIEYGIRENDSFAKLFDADNRDSKKAIDAMTGTFFDDDNVLAIRTYQYGVRSKVEMTRILIMEFERFAVWIGKN